MTKAVKDNPKTHEKNGSFAKGNQLHLLRKSNRGGKLLLTANGQSFNDLYPYAADEMLELLYLNAKDHSDIKAASILLDRLRGRAASSLEISLTGTIMHQMATPEQIQSLVDARLSQVEADIEALKEYRPKLLVSGTYVSEPNVT